MSDHALTHFCSFSLFEIDRVLWVPDSMAGKGQKNSTFVTHQSLLQYTRNHFSIRYNFSCSTFETSPLPFDGTLLSKIRCQIPIHQSSKSHYRNLHRSPIIFKQREKNLNSFNNPSAQLMIPCNTLFD